MLIARYDDFDHDKDMIRCSRSWFWWHNDLMFKIMIKGGLARCVQQRLSSTGVGRPEDKWQRRSIILPGWLPVNNDNQDNYKTYKMLIAPNNYKLSPQCHLVTFWSQAAVEALVEARHQVKLTKLNMSSWVMMGKKHEFMSSWVIMVTRAHSYIGGSTGGSSTTISGSTFIYNLHNI